MYEVVKSWLLWGALLLIVSTCATPVAPIGKPLEKKPPTIVRTSPQAGQLGVRASTIEVSFDRFMNRNSLRNQLQIEPDLGLDYTTRWKRKTLFIDFNQPLPDSVTVILTLGAQLMDVDGNSLGAPYRLGFSSGNRLDSAKVAFTVRSFHTGKGEAGRAIGLFRDALHNEPAIYINQTDTSGQVSFSYLRQWRYDAVLFEDRNRNRKIDSQEFAQPGVMKVEVGSQKVPTTAEIIYFKPDTLAPTLLGVGLLSSQRLRVRFSEPIRLSARSQISIVDSLSTTTRADWLNTDPDNPSVAYAHSSTPLSVSQRFNIAIEPVEDESGNKVVALSEPFKGNAQKDTVSLRLLRLQAPTVVSPSDSLMVIYNRVLDQSSVLDSLLLVDGDRLIRNYPGVAQKANRLYVYDPKGWSSGQNYQLRVWDPFLQKHQTISFRPLDPGNNGSLEVKYPDGWQNQNIVLEVLNEQLFVQKRLIVSGNTTLSGMVPGSYYVRTWIDRNDNGRWEAGRWNQGRPDRPEPVFLRPNVPISARMTSTIEVITEAE